MSVLSDLLRIPHFTTARGSTVRKDFLEAVATALKADVRNRSKDEVLALCIETATRDDMPPDLYSIGGTVTDRALQAIIDGIVLNGIPGEGTDLAAVAEVVPEIPPDAEFVEGEVLDPNNFTDERDRRLYEIAVRQGQDSFRQSVLEAYNNRCAVTGFDAVAALEATHIVHYQGPATNVTSNGICLRADIHNLFDRGALAVDETRFTVTLRPDLAVTAYQDLDGHPVELPRERALRPSVAALQYHREWCGL